MHLDLPGQGGVGATEGTDQCFDASVDVGAVEGRDAGLDEPRHVFDRLLGIDRAVAASQMPAALDEAGHRVTIGEGIPGNHLVRPSGGVTAVTSERRKRRRPMRVIRNRVGQLGSGQAISASVDIQSFGSVIRCLAGSSGSSAASEYMENPCPGGSLSISPW